MKKTIRAAATFLAAIASVAILGCSNGTPDPKIIEKEVIKEVVKNVVMPVFISYKETAGGMIITLSTVTEGAKIFYTLDNTNPTTSSKLYANPFTVTNCKVIKAFAVKEGLADSPINSVEIVEYSETSAPSGYQIKKNISLNGALYDRTGEVVCLPYSGGSKTITSTDDSAYSSWNGFSSAGEFRSGTSTIINPFILNQYEVTRRLFLDVMGGDPSVYKESEHPHNGKYYDVDVNSKYPGEEGLLPVNNVSLFMIIAFCNKLSIAHGLDPVYSYKVSGTEVDWSNITYDTIVSDYSDNKFEKSDIAVDITKNGYRMPTFAEREFAARGGNENSEEWKYAFSGVDTTKPLYLPLNEYKALSENEKKYYNSERFLIEESNLNDYAWYSKTAGYTFSYNDGTELSFNYPHKVGAKKPNSLNLYDMTGNVSEILVSINEGKIKGIYVAGGNFDNSLNYCANGYNSPYSQTLLSKYGFRLCRTIVSK